MRIRSALSALFVVAVASVPMGATAHQCAAPCARSGETWTAQWLYELTGWGSQGIDVSLWDDTHVSGSLVTPSAGQSLRFWDSYGFECFADAATLTVTANPASGLVTATTAPTDPCLPDYSFSFTPSGSGTVGVTPPVSVTPPVVEVGESTTWNGTTIYTWSGWGPFALPGTTTIRHHRYTASANL